MTGRCTPRLAAARMGLAGLALTAVLAAGCATPPDPYHPLHVRAPRDAKGEFHIEESPRGFTILVEYARHQARPDGGAVARACRTALVGIAREMAEVRGRVIKPIDENTVAVAIRRNETTRLTFCDARLAVEYAD